MYFIFSGTVFNIFYLKSSRSLQGIDWMMNIEKQNITLK